MSSLYLTATTTDQPDTACDDGGKSDEDWSLTLEDVGSEGNDDEEIQTRPIGNLPRRSDEQSSEAGKYSVIKSVWFLSAWDLV